MQPQREIGLYLLSSWKGLLRSLSVPWRHRGGGRLSAAFGHSLDGRGYRCAPSADPSPQSPLAGGHSRLALSNKQEMGSFHNAPFFLFVGLGMIVIGVAELT